MSYTTKLCMLRFLFVLDTADRKSTSERDREREREERQHGKSKLLLFLSNVKDHHLDNL